MISMYIGSGDTTQLLSGVHTKGHHKLLRRFVSGVKPYYNAKASPIDALRTGAIIEERYELILSDNYYPQVKAICEQQNVLTCSIDFAKIEKGKVVDFQELKSCSFNDFLEFEKFRNNPEKGVEYIKKKYKNNYRQLQEQLLCTGLESAEIVFVVVYTYDDEINYNRDIKENEIIKFRIQRDETVIKMLLDKSNIFQQIKNTYHEQTN